METTAEQSDPWADDLLDRKSEAEFLIADLLQRSKIASQKGYGSVSVNIDAPWGSGKTFFAKGLLKHLSVCGFQSIYIDAWADDYADDPFSVLAAQVLAVVGKGQNAKALSESVGRLLVSVVKGGTKTLASKVIGEDGVTTIAETLGEVFLDASADQLSEYADKKIKALSEARKSVRNFRSELEEAIANLDANPVFIIVDELDRCSPSYAIRFLERIKHLFDVRGIVFVFLTNTEQLSHTVRGFYGIGFDANTYLRRFFTRTYLLSAPNKTRFVELVWSELGLDEKRYFAPFQSSAVDFIAFCCDKLHVTLRDVHQCLQIMLTLQANWRSKIEIPLGFAFPLIVLSAYRYDILVDELETPSKADYHAFSAHAPVLWERMSAAGFYGKLRPDQGSSLAGIFLNYLEFSRKPLTENVGNRQQYLLEELAQFRNREFALLHQNTFSPGSPPIPTWAKLYQLIRNAKRFS